MAEGCEASLRVKLSNARAALLELLLLALLALLALDLRFGLVDLALTVAII